MRTNLRWPMNLTWPPTASASIEMPRSGKDLRRIILPVWKLLPFWSQRALLGLFAPKYSVAACAVIQDSQGQVLLLHHTYRRHAWGLPGGLLEQNEQPSTALAREISEELGVPASVGELIYAETRPNRRHLTLYYQVTVEGTPRCDEVEIDGFRYVESSQLSSFLGSSANLPVDRLHQAPLARSHFALL